MLPNLLNTAVIVFGGLICTSYEGRSYCSDIWMNFYVSGELTYKVREADKGPADSFDHCRTAW